METYMYKTINLRDTIDICVCFLLQICISQMRSSRVSLRHTARVDGRAYNICFAQLSVCFLSVIHSETRIIARGSHSIFWNSDCRQRFPLKSTEVWKYRKHRFCVLKWALQFPSPLHSTGGIYMPQHISKIDKIMGLFCKSYKSDNILQKRPIIFFHNKASISQQIWEIRQTYICVYL